MVDAVAKCHPDYIIHLGDVVRDAQGLQKKFPHIPMTNVAGNCDSVHSPAPQEAEVTLEGVKFLLFHGHNHQVKLSPYRAVLDARSRGADVLLYGHTHQAVCFQEDTLWVMNPGSVGTVVHGTYGVITIDQGTIDARLVDC